QITFWHKFDLPAGSVGTVEASADNGLTWTPVYTQTTPFTTWTEVNVDLSAYAGQQIKLAFALEESGGGGQSAVPNPAKTATAVALPITMLAVAMVGVGQISNKREMRHWLKRLFLWGIALVVLWNCMVWSGIWLSIPPLRAWRINDLTSVKGGTTDLVVSASQQPGGAHISPNGRWLMVSQRYPYKDWLLLDLETGEKKQINEMRVASISRWVADDLWVGEDNSRSAFLMSVPDLTRTQFQRYDNSGGIEVVKELLWQSDHIYALDEGGAYYFLITGDDYRYGVTFPGGITKEETETFLTELPQVAIILSHPSMTPTMVPEIDSYKPLRRFYSPDGSLYAYVFGG
ncbi:MAG: hypothetical protein GY805_15240, partial [Chloroflexi bacterium]|nr:hypothetical protein [Chloroflexota bacterium]